MHRVRSWARQKARGTPPLAVDPRRVSAAQASPGPNAPTAAGADANGGAVPPENGAAGVRPNPPENAATGDDNDAHAPGGSEKPVPPQPPVVKRFFLTVWGILISSYVNILLVFVPVGIAAHFAHLSAGIVFAMNAIAIIPLAGLLTHATESVACRLGDTVGALMNVTFGNAVELIILIALVKDEIAIVQASLVGSILANLLLILGMSFFLGGLRYREQIYNSTVTQMSACLLSLSTAFHASFNNASVADTKVLEVSRGTSVVLLLVYVLYLLFQLNSHAYMYQSTPQEIIDREAVPGPAANYFNSSSSSESSSSSSDSDSDQSQSTARRIKCAIKKGRNRMHSRHGSSSNGNAEAPASPKTLESPDSPKDASERVGTDDVPEMPGADAGVVADDEAEAEEEAHASRRHHRKKHKHKKRTASPSDPAAGDHGDDIGAAAAAAGMPVRPGAPEGGRPRHVQFDLGPDVEAQTQPRPKPFSLRSLANPAVLSRTLSTNVFNAHAAPSGGGSSSSSNNPPLHEPASLANAAAHAGPARPQPQLRRTVSLPDDAQRYRLPPGTFPPIVPIVVNRTPRTLLAMSEDGGGDGAGSGGSSGAAGNHVEPDISRTTAILLLLVSTGLVALCAEFMVGSINDVVRGNSGLSEAFVGLILLPIVGNAAEHVTGVTVAMKNKMDLALGVALGSSIQIAIFVTPVVVLLGWILHKDMSLYFTLFETVSMFVSAFIVNFLVLDGRSNYLEGALLCAAYVIIAVAAFFYPNAEAANALGGGPANSTEAAVVTHVVRGMVNLVARPA
ncbi:sodium/calcium exchanger protein [Niveomyces insectorum RCEF 264]|uniref:Sodium/calcium exchanger protein n=1 Tax=Niveomyces insectorum RCEF 264 TaxID=1081102 RepID=A0A167UNZ5_9HYPO|nr:sodium/calcium exchanger protein [Niveomyces insectorum RCEF 264]